MSYLLTFIAGAVSIITLEQAMNRKNWKQGLFWSIACIVMAGLLHWQNL